MKRLALTAILLLAATACGEATGDEDTDTTAVVEGDPSATPSATGPAGPGTSPESSVPGPANPEPSVPGPAEMPAPSVQMITAMPANNYTFSSTLAIDVTPVKPSSELTFDWSAVGKDLIGHDLDPTVDVDMLTLLMWSLSREELAVKLNADTLAQSDLVAIAMIYTEDETATDMPKRTSGSLFEMTSFGAEILPEQLLGYLDIEAYDPAEYSYTIMAVTGTTAGQGTRMIQGFALDPESENTHVAMTSDSTALDYQVDLMTAQPTPVPMGDPALGIDWEDMTTTALGTPFIPTYITEVLVARYQMDPTELEANFLDLELIADKTYRGEVLVGASYELSELTDEAGAPFPGVDDQGTWVVALFCGKCANPAPWYLSLLQPQ